MIWLVNSTLSFIPLVHNASFKIIMNSGVRIELNYLPFSLLIQLQKNIVEEHLFGVFSLATLTFGTCTSPTDTFPFNYLFTSVTIYICYPLNCSTIWVIDNFQLFQCQINILDNSVWRRCSSYLKIPYTIQSSGDSPPCWSDEAHIPSLFASFLPHTICNSSKQYACARSVRCHYLASYIKEWTRRYYQQEVHSKESHPVVNWGEANI